MLGVTLEKIFGKRGVAADCCIITDHNGTLFSTKHNEHYFINVYFYFFGVAVGEICATVDQDSGSTDRGRRLRIDDLSTVFGDY